MGYELQRTYFMFFQQTINDHNPNTSYAILWLVFETTKIFPMWLEHWYCWKHGFEGTGTKEISPVSSEQGCTLSHMDFKAHVLRRFFNTTLPLQSTQNTHKCMSFTHMIYKKTCCSLCNAKWFLIQIRTHMIWINKCHGPKWYLSKIHMKTKRYAVNMWSKRLMKTAATVIYHNCNSYHGNASHS